MGNNSIGGGVQTSNIKSRVESNADDSKAFN